MSLINEALQRAEAEKRSREGAGADDDDNLSVWPAPEDDIPYIFGRHQKGLRGAILLGGIVIATVAVVMYFSLPPVHNGLSPARAGGAAGTAPARSQPASGPKATATAEAEGDVALTPPMPTPQAAPAATRPTPAVSAKPTPPPVKTVVATAPAGAPPAAPRDPPLRPANFKLGAILQSNGSGYALINNQMVTTGDVIDGARVVIIRKYHVVIERKGQRLVLRM